MDAYLPFCCWYCSNSSLSSCDVRLRFVPLSTYSFKKTASINGANTDDGCDATAPATHTCSTCIFVLNL